MPLLYQGSGQGAGGMLLPVSGTILAGAQLIGMDGAVGTLPIGSPNQVLAVDDSGALAWVNFSPSELGEIPVASGAQLGVVRSAGDDVPDSIAVQNVTGVMTVNSLNIAKLYVADGDEWVLQAGTSHR